jgi:gluconokinase
MILVVMGVAGCGKSTVGQLLADRLGWRFADADDFHSESNRQKMRAGLSLTDDDRWPWLASIRAFIETTVSSNANAVIACSALKRKYRDVLRGSCPEAVHFFYLCGSPTVIAERLRMRKNHFFNPDALAGQFAALEEPHEDEASIIDVDCATVDNIVDEIVGYVAQKKTLMKPS